VGSEESTLIAQLSAQKFKVTAIDDPAGHYRRKAYYESHAIPCKETWTVRWVADQGKITSIEGRDSGQLCL
jgi:hypothetical protein